MNQFATVCEGITATTKKLQKISIVAEYLKSIPIDDAATAAIFLSGRPFPAWEETTLQIGGRSLWRIVADLSGKQEAELTASYRRLGDLGAVAGDLLPQKSGDSLQIPETERTFRQIATTRGPSEKAALVRDLLSRVSPVEAKYIIKIVTGDLRIGLKESLVEEAIAKAFGSALPEVQRANMLLGDIGHTLRLAAQHKLSDATMRLFHPLGFMLASPVESPEEGLSFFSHAAVEDKYDGIRAQAHISAGEVRLFSRTRDEITESFPELPPALAGLPDEAVLDGEIVAWEYPHKLEAAKVVVDEPISEESELKAQSLGRARPFSMLQQRLGRKKVSDNMLRDNPVAFLVFDVLYTNGNLVIDYPLHERARILDQFLSAERNHSHSANSTRMHEQGALPFGDQTELESAAVIRAPVFQAKSPEELDQLFVAARARGNEGLMIKDLNSPYSPGKRGKSWLKMKRELATLDVVVTAAEYGHGKRIGVLSDYTFAVWDGDKLANIGKAYSGLTDVEIADMTEWFLEHTIEDQGFRRLVEPKIVLEVAFNNMMQSDRHESGFALRFPRIVRLRPDKSAVDADTLERARAIYEQQQTK
jgi:DNA ligase-1